MNRVLQLVTKCGGPSTSLRSGRDDVVFWGVKVGKTGNGRCNRKSKSWMRGSLRFAFGFGRDDVVFDLLLSQGNGWMVVLKRDGSSKSVRSPGFLPGMGWRRAERG